VNAVFSSRFKADLDAEVERYRSISERLASAFTERVAGQAREIVKWKGGDHVGPHMFNQEALQASASSPGESV
jgi:hypothetical protein